MDHRPDTSSSSGRFRGQWSFLATAPHNAQPRSVPASSYLPQSTRSSISPHAHHGTTGSRSTLPRNLTTASIGGRSSATTPSQPILIRVHSADASAHLNPAPRPRRQINMGRNNGLPALSEFSLHGILASIQEDAESDINTISEILGRSRLVLADQHDSHMPPQGEILAMPNFLQAVEEASANDERFATDDVFVLREDASLIEGSQGGSAAYGLLERLQAVSRHRVDNDILEPRTPHTDRSSLLNSPIRNTFSPTAIGEERRSMYDPHRASRQLLQTRANEVARLRTTSAIVSESHLSAAMTGTTSDEPPPGSEESHYRSINEREADEGSDSNTSHHRRSITERVQRLFHVNDPTGLTAWLQGQSHDESASSYNAEGHLRGLLGR